MTTYTIVKAKCTECFRETMDRFPKDVHYIRNQIIEEKKQPKVVCVQIIVGNQVLVLCERHLKAIQRLFNGEKS